MRARGRGCAAGLLAGGSLLPSAAWGAPAGGPAPALIWGLPFLGVLLSIALFPMFAPRLWHRRMGLIALAWSLALLLPLAASAGWQAAAQALWHAAWAEYLPFVTLLLALYVAAGGVLVRGGPGGTPGGNVAMLALGTVLAGLMGTTGAAMVLVHPLLRANAHRERKVHLVVFFILLVANVGGATTPLGDPPLYLGFLLGVPFFWPLRHLAAPFLLASALLLAAFYVIDRRLAAADPPRPEQRKLRVRGWPNIVLIGVVIAAVLAQGLIDLPAVSLLGEPVTPDGLAAMAVFLAVAALSLVITPRAVRGANEFTWGPMEEVAKLFAAIFVTIGPVIAMLNAKLAGPFAPILHLTTDAAGQPVPAAYFWLTGLLSGFLDNAPTYLVFFNLAGIDPGALSGHENLLLEAISAGAVFFGGLTYIGNAPNMMVRAIAAHRGVRMPGFFAYLTYAAAALLPVFAVVTLLFYI